jgi:hypothetical protein
VLDFGLAKIDFLAKGQVYEGSTAVQEHLTSPLISTGHGSGHNRGITRRGIWHNPTNFDGAP